MEPLLRNCVGVVHMVYGNGSGQLLFNKNETVYFNKNMCESWTKDKGATMFDYVTEGDRVRFDAVPGPDGAACKYRATKVWSLANPVETKWQAKDILQGPSAELHPANEMPAIVFLARQLHENGPMKITNLAKSLSKVTVVIRKHAGSTASDLQHFLRKYSNHFTVTDTKNIVILETNFDDILAIDYLVVVLHGWGVLPVTRMADYLSYVSVDIKKAAGSDAHGLEKFILKHSCHFVFSRTDNAVTLKGAEYPTNPSLINTTSILAVTQIERTLLRQIVEELEKIRGAELEDICRKFSMNMQDVDISIEGLRALIHKCIPVVCLSDGLVRLKPSYKTVIYRIIQETVSKLPEEADTDADRRESSGGSDISDDSVNCTTSTNTQTVNLHGDEQSLHTGTVRVAVTRVEKDAIDFTVTLLEKWGELALNKIYGHYNQASPHVFQMLKKPKLTDGVKAFVCRFDVIFDIKEGMISLQPHYQQITYIDIENTPQVVGNTEEDPHPIPVVESISHVKYKASDNLPKCEKYHIVQLTQNEKIALDLLIQILEKKDEIMLSKMHGHFHQTPTEVKQMMGNPDRCCTFVHAFDAVFNIADGMVSLKPKKKKVPTATLR